MRIVPEIGFGIVLFVLGMIVGDLRHPTRPAHVEVAVTLPADCRPRHVGQVAAVVIIDNEARCLVSEFDVPKRIWLDYLHAKVVAK